VTWIAAEDPGARDIMLAVNGRLLGCCTGVDADQGVVEVIPVIGIPGYAPTVHPPVNGEFLRERLKVPVEIVTSTYKKGWLYWTGEGWLDETSKPVQGPLVEHSK